MLPVYSHCNESCIDPMLLSLPPPGSTPATTASSTTSRTLMKTTTAPHPTAIRNSIVSQYSSTTASGSTRRDSFGSSEGDKEDLQTRRWSAESASYEHVLSPTSPTTSSFSSLQPSSRFLLSGATSSETFRQQELSRFYPSTTTATSPLSVIAPPVNNTIPVTTATTATATSSRRIKALSDPFVTMPSIALAAQPIQSQSFLNDAFIGSEQPDPWCMSVKLALDNAACKDWLYKYESPTFAFARSWKRRYIILADRTVYMFKSNKHTTPAREHFLLTDDTLIFVTEDFRKGCVIEMRKPLCKWYLRCESVTQMKYWLEAMKKVVACLKLRCHGPLTPAFLSSLTLTDDSRLLTAKKRSSQQSQQSQQQVHPALMPQTFESSPQLARSSTTATAATLPHIRNKRSSNPIISPSNLPGYTTSSKRQSLAQIPHWEKTLPPQMPPPSTLPPPPPQPQPSLSSSSSSTSLISPPAVTPRHNSISRPLSATFSGYHYSGASPSLSTVSESASGPIEIQHD